MSEVVPCCRRANALILFSTQIFTTNLHFVPKKWQFAEVLEMPFVPRYNVFAVSRFRTLILQHVFKVLDTLRQRILQLVVIHRQHSNDTCQHGKQLVDIYFSIKYICNVGKGEEGSI